MMAKAWVLFYFLIFVIWCNRFYLWSTSPGWFWILFLCIFSPGVEWLLDISQLKFREFNVKNGWSLVVKPMVTTKNETRSEALVNSNPRFTWGPTRLSVGPFSLCECYSEPSHATYRAVTWVKQCTANHKHTITVLMMLLSVTSVY